MAGLPEGLVTNSQTITGEISRFDHVDVEDIITLWKGIALLHNYVVRQRLISNPSILDEQDATR